ncbi:hypothetical protein ABK040_015500 [Willaertia magna]
MFSSDNNNKQQLPITNQQHLLGFTNNNNNNNNTELAKLVGGISNLSINTGNLTSFRRKQPTEDVILSGNEELDETRSVSSCGSNHSELRDFDILFQQQQQSQSTTTPYRYSNSSFDSKPSSITSSIDSSNLSWEEVQNAIRFNTNPTSGSSNNNVVEMERMKEKINTLQKNNLTLSQSLYTANKEHLTLVNQLKEKLHELLPSLLIENQKLKEQVQLLQQHVNTLEQQINSIKQENQLIKIENEKVKNNMENQMIELKKEIEYLKQSNKNNNINPLSNLSKGEKIQQLILLDIKPYEEILKLNNILVKKCSDEIYQLGQFKLNVDLDNNQEMIVIHLSDKTVAFKEFLRTFCSRFTKDFRH